MELPKKECIHIADVLKQTKTALNSKDSLKLKSLSNQTIHTACNYQDEASITIAVLLYTLSKITERLDFKKIKSWPDLVRKLNSILDSAISALNKNDLKEYKKHIQNARETLESESLDLKPYIKEVLKKAAINKGSKIHEHGISLEQTSKLLGTSQWELSEYIGQKTKYDKHNQTLDTKTRARMALEFFQ